LLKAASRLFRARFDKVGIYEGARRCFALVSFQTLLPSWQRCTTI
jgi:hypothetical protein